MFATDTNRFSRRTVVDLRSFGLRASRPRQTTPRTHTREKTTAEQASKAVARETSERATSSSEKDQSTFRVGVPGPARIPPPITTIASASPVFLRSPSALSAAATKKRKRESSASAAIRPTTPPPAATAVAKKTATTLHIGVDMPLREPSSPLALSFSMAAAKDAAAPTILDQCLQLPKLNLGSCSARSSAARPKFLDLIEPLRHPFTMRPTWCLEPETYSQPRAVTLLDVYKNHEFLTTHTVYQKGMYLIGRTAGMCDIVLSHCSISRLHATLMHHEDGSSVYLIDLGSAHGTFMDGLRLKQLQPTLLVHGSQLRFGASSRSYTFKAFDSREQIAEIVRAQVGLDAEQLALNHNTLLNRAISYRLELSPNMQNDDPMAYPSAADANIHGQEDHQPPPGVGHQRRSSTDELSFSLAAFRHDEPARKRSRGQSGNSQGSSDNSMGETSSGLTALDTLLDDADEDEVACVLKRVHFTTQPPLEIPPATPFPVSPAGPESAWGAAANTSNGSSGDGPQGLRLNLGGLATLTIPTPQDACS